jgi:O-antigen/teichoic acid export membrane protein
MALRKLINKGINFLSNKTTRNGMFATVDQGIVSATNFLTSVIIARACSKDQFGLYILCLSIILILSDIQTYLVSTPYMVFSPHLHDRENALYTGSTLIHQIAIGLLSIIFIFMLNLIPYFGFISTSGLELLLRILALIICFVLLRNYIRQLCFAKKRIVEVLIYDVIIFIIQLGLLYLVYQKGRITVYLSFLIIGLASSILSVIWILLNTNQFKVDFTKVYSDLKRNWTIGKWFCASGIIWTISLNLYPWILAAYNDSSVAGIWAACMGVVGLLNPLLIGGQNVVGPEIMHRYAKSGIFEMTKFVLRVIPGFFVLLLVFTIPIIFFGDDLVSLIYGEKYRGYGSIVKILVPNLLITATMFSLSRSLFAIERANIDFVINLTAIIIQITFGVWLISNFGIIGAAYGYLSTKMITFILISYAFIKLIILVEKNRNENK